jgi:hypothetical protein
MQVHQHHHFHHHRVAMSNVPAGTIPVMSEPDSTIVEVDAHGYATNRTSPCTHEGVPRRVQKLVEIPPRPVANGLVIDGGDGAGKWTTWECACGKRFVEDELLRGAP